ncbi:MAG: transcriptional regulator [Alphaproteobacteria bacterium HGW-Alphaproteobacteria-18]|nr:MAG: transcriptional regulator [Alphaproteobacteria bacterium HGW-Alphaproteobacteria-18]
MPNIRSPDSTALDRGFHALADATRRGVIARLAQGEASVADLAAPYDMALPSFLQHVRVLEEAGLISTVKTGRVRTCRLEAERLAALNRWIAEYEAGWAARLDRLGDILDRKGDTQ